MGVSPMLAVHARARRPCHAEALPKSAFICVDLRFQSLRIGSPVDPGGNTSAIGSASLIFPSSVNSIRAMQVSRV